MYAVHDFVPWLAVDVAEFEDVPLDGVCREELDHIHDGDDALGLDFDLFLDAILNVCDFEGQTCGSAADPCLAGDSVRGRDFDTGVPQFCLKAGQPCPEGGLPIFRSVILREEPFQELPLLDLRCCFHDLVPPWILWWP